MLLSEFLKDVKDSKYLNTKDWQDPNNQNKTKPDHLYTYGSKDDLPIIEFQGMQIAIENEVGSIREGIDKDGNKWANTFKFPYGYIIGTLGRDNEEVDVYIGKNKKSDRVFIVRQHIDGLPDEDKCFLGFDNQDQAEECYHDHMSNPDNFHRMLEVSMDEFKKLTLKR